MNAVSAQSTAPLLERNVTLTLEREPLENALKKIGKEGGFNFSYNPAVVKVDKLLTYNFANKTIREILDEIFQGTVHYRVRGKYVILTRAENSSSRENKALSGYVIDEATGKRLSQVSIYDPVSLASAVTDEYGYFRIELPETPKDSLKLAVRKSNYTDTLVAVTPDKGRLLRIGITTDKLGVIADSLGSKMKRFFRSTKSLTTQAINFENIEDTLYRDIQFSVVPFVSTNHNLSGHVINDYSVNLFGGYSLGIEKLEFGGLFNTVRGHVNGIQIAGLFNAVGGDVRAIQLAGLVNANRGIATGAQLAGAVNFYWRTSHTVGLAGLVNYHQTDSRGVRVAGLGNATIGKHEGPQVAGLFNFSTGDAGPANIAGLLNFTAGNMRGAQVAGLVNFTAGNLRGSQVGLLNYSRRIRGTQVGFINFADTISGVPVGFLSIVGKGYHSIEVSADEIFYTNVAFRTGVRKFYNILTAGAKPSTFAGDETSWIFGYGIGSSPKLTRWLYLNVDLTASQVVQGNSIEAINMINKLYLGFEIKPTAGLAVIFGATLNGNVTKADYDQYPELFTDYTPSIIYERTYSNETHLKMWWGGKIGLRFL
ncbi:MAG TPA: STN and carboxypeptidase regulatory-like domain-containing protein [Ohtaekwangia sp.]|nr:STN and carboxypeptidase regulatory-like domain-containing protein [Ohtaekwangia sp.]